MVQGNTAETLAEHSDTGGCHEDWHTADIICGGFPCQDISNAGAGTGITGTRSGLWAYLCGAIRMVRPLYGVVENVAALLSNGMDTVLGDLAEIGYDAEWHCVPASAIGAPHERDRVWIVAHGLSEQAHKQLQEPGGFSYELWRTLASGTEATRPEDWPASNDDATRLDEILRKAGDCEVSGLVDGLPGRVDKKALKALGNTVVPQIPELIARAIVASAR